MMKREEAFNYAIGGLPTDRIRFHLCWWRQARHGRTLSGRPTADIVGFMLAIDAWRVLVRADQRMAL
jgi:5-methyltetrahydropteroyltriglutamate--homocysteine methyltransferase